MPLSCTQIIVSTGAYLNTRTQSTRSLGVVYLTKEETAARAEHISHMALPSQAALVCHTCSARHTAAPREACESCEA